MGSRLDDELIEKELETRRVIKRIRKYLHFSPEETESLRGMYERVAKGRTLDSVSRGIQNSKNDLKNLQLWGRLQGEVVKNYKNIMHPEEFTGRFLGLDEEQWGCYWNSGERGDIPYQFKENNFK